MAIVPENRRLFGPMTVLENLEMGAYLHGGGDPRGLRARLLALPAARTSDGRQLAGTLSGGEQQMVAMGRALMARPKLLLMDEPSMGLAPILVERSFEIIKQVHEAGVAMLVVEQNANVSLSIADRGYVLSTGPDRARGEGVGAPPARGAPQGLPWPVMGSDPWRLTPSRGVRPYGSDPWPVRIGPSSRSSSTRSTRTRARRERSRTASAPPPRSGSRAGTRTARSGSSGSSGTRPRALRSRGSCTPSPTTSPSRPRSRRRSARSSRRSTSPASGTGSSSASTSSRPSARSRMRRSSAARRSSTFGPSRTAGSRSSASRRRSTSGRRSSAAPRLSFRSGPPARRLGRSPSSATRAVRSSSPTATRRSARSSSTSARSAPTWSRAGR